MRLPDFEVDSLSLDVEYGLCLPRDQRQHQRKNNNKFLEKRRFVSNKAISYCRFTAKFWIVIDTVETYFGGD